MELHKFSNSIPRSTITFQYSVYQNYYTKVQYIIENLPITVLSNYLDQHYIFISSINSINYNYMLQSKFEIT